MTKPLRNGDGRTSDGHEYTQDGVGYLGVVPCAQHRADAMRDRAAHATGDMPKGSRR